MRCAPCATGASGLPTLLIGQTSTSFIPGALTARAEGGHDGATSSTRARIWTAQPDVGGWRNYTVSAVRPSSCDKPAQPRKRPSDP
jgi:hypothetical protein